MAWREMTLSNFMLWCVAGTCGCAAIGTAGIAFWPGRETPAIADLATTRPLPPLRNVDSQPAETPAIGHVAIAQTPPAQAVIGQPIAGHAPAQIGTGRAVASQTASLLPTLPLPPPHRAALARPKLRSAPAHAKLTPNLRDMAAMIVAQDLTRGVEATPPGWRVRAAPPPYYGYGYRVRRARYATSY